MKSDEIKYKPPFQEAYLFIGELFAGGLVGFGIARYLEGQSNILESYVIASLLLFSGLVALLLRGAWNIHKHSYNNVIINHNVLKSLQGQLETMEKNLKVRGVEYIPSKSTNDVRELVFLRLTEEVENAKSEILVVNYFTGRGEEESEEENISENAKKARENYYKVLISKAQDKTITYQRRIQYDNAQDQKLLNVLKNQPYHNHFREMKTHDSTQIRVIPTQRPITFTMIDREKLLLQVDKLVSRGNRVELEMHGILIITDTSGDLCNEFRDFFIARDDLSRELKDADLIS